jgi:ABC transporter, ATP-binding protein
MVHQHFKLVHNFTVLESIVLGHETVKNGVLKMEDARKKVMELSEKYKFKIDPDAFISDITVGMQQRVEILKMLYCDNEVLIFDEPTAVLTPQEVNELMKVMLQLVQEGKSIIFITHKLNEIKAVANRCSVLRKGKYIGTIDVAQTSKEEMSEMMVGRKVDFIIDKQEINLGEPVLEVKNLTIHSKQKRESVKNVSFTVRRGEILTIAGIDGNGQSELVYGITGLMPIEEGEIFLNQKNITKESIRQKCLDGLAHIPEDRHKDGLVLDYTLQENLVLQSYYTKEFQKNGFLKFDAIRQYAKKLIEKFDIRSAQGEDSIVRGMSGGNQQKAIIARELDRNPEIVIAVQPVRGLDVGAIEYIHKQLIAQRDSGKAVLLVSLELDEVMNVSDRILVMYEGEIVADVNPTNTTVEELGLYMSGAKRGVGYEA